MNYDISELIDDKVIKVNIKIGFRIQPKTELYFKKIVQDLVTNKELNLHIRPDGSSKYNKEPDFKFVVIEKFLSVENEFSVRDGLLLRAYYRLKEMGQSDEKAFGLDKSDVIVEYIPFIYKPQQIIDFERVDQRKAYLQDND
jgi:KUP system potassium uptake protein